MKFTNPTTDVYVPDGADPNDALRRSTHVGIGAHQDDLEFMAFHGILAGYENPERWFGGVTCTNGSGSARTGAFADCTDEEMQQVRREEQRKAAEIGQYGAMLQLDFPSSVIKNPENGDLARDLLSILEIAQPDVVYTHNPADKHDTHIAVFSAVLDALRTLPSESQPKEVYGCEVWRGLDWMLDEDKVALDVSGKDVLARTLNGLFASQIAGGKRYDLATIGRRRSNATFFESHSVDETDQVWFAMDLLPLVQDPSIQPANYVQTYIDRFSQDVQEKLRLFT